MSLYSDLSRLIGDLFGKHGIAYDRSMLFGTTLTQPQLDEACGNGQTKPPKGLTIQPCE